MMLLIFSHSSYAFALPKYAVLRRARAVKTVEVPLIIDASSETGTFVGSIEITYGWDLLPLPQMNDSAMKRYAKERFCRVDDLKPKQGRISFGNSALLIPSNVAPLVVDGVTVRIIETDGSQRDLEISCRAGM
jgi:hypothetical protein